MATVARGAVTLNRRFAAVVRTSLTWTAMLATVLAATSCSHAVDLRAMTVMPNVGTPIAWVPCQVTPAIPPGAQCGELDVPVDYADADAGTAALALIKFPATGAKIGSLIINPGGPGGSGVQAAAWMVQLLRPQLRERFDLVGFDPRGVGNSTPAVRCNSDADNDRLRADAQVDYGPAGVEHIKKLTKEFVQRCMDKKGLEFLATVGAANVAKDLDVLRAALGDAKLTYLGSSYGTRVGSEYAEAYPQNVRAMVLDGAVDPNADPIEATVRQTAGFQRAFNDYAADCAKSPDCPLGTDPAKAVDIYRSMVDPLVQKPAPTGDGRGLSYGDAIVGTILTLYSPHGWRHLAEGLNELKAGRGDALLTLADLYMGRDAQGHYNNSIDVRMAVNCADQPPVNDRAKVIEADRRLREGAPFIGYGEFTGHALLGTCAFWPVPPTSTPQPISVQGLPPALVVSTTHDPAAPYQAGVDLARQLGGRLLTFEGTQHTVVLQGNACVDDIAARYLVDLALPSPDTRC